MSIRTQDLQAIAPVLATFDISQTASVDDLKDTNIGEPVTLTASNEVGPIGDGELLLGKLISLTLSDNDDGDRQATVQVGGVCRLDVSATVPSVGFPFVVEVTRIFSVFLPGFSMWVTSSVNGGIQSVS